MKMALALFAIGVSMSTAVVAQQTWKEKFEKVSDEYFAEVYFRYAPSPATMIGFHQYDTQLEDFSRPTIDTQIAARKNFEKRLEAIQPDSSTANLLERSDRE